MDISLKDVKTAIVTGVTVVIASIAGIVGTVVRHWMGSREQRKSKEIERRRERIGEWRDMVGDVAKTFDDLEDKNEVKISALLKRNKSFYSLQPYLKKEVLKQLFSDEPYTIAVSIGYPLPPRLNILIEEIARLEKQWGLM